MTREDSIRQIENYPPFNEQEEKDKALILGWISNNENAFPEKIQLRILRLLPGW